MDLGTPNRSQNQLVRATFQGSSFRSFALPPRGSALVSLPAFEGASQVPLFLPSVFLLLAGEETLEVAGPSCELTNGGNYLDLVDLRFDARFAISSLSTFSMKLERVLFSAFASATSLDFNARSILKDIVVSFTVAADNTL